MSYESRVGNLTYQRCDPSSLSSSSSSSVLLPCIDCVSPMCLNMSTLFNLTLGNLIRDQSLSPNTLSSSLSLTSPLSFPSGDLSSVPEIPLDIMVRGNDSNLDENSKAYVISTHVKLLWIFVYMIMIMMATLGNLGIIWIIIGHRKMRTVTNIFILNLSIADLITSILNITFNFIFMLFGQWYFGYFFCKINTFIAYLTLSASVFTIMALSLERYRIVINPMKPRITRRTCVVCLTFIWLISSLLSLPTLIYATFMSFDNQSTNITRHICILRWPDGGPGVSNADFYFNVIIFAVDYAIPMILMTVTYYRIGKVFWGSQAIGELTEGQREAIRGRQRVVTMLITVTVLFAICWLPYHIYFLYMYYDPEIMNHKYISNIYLTIYWLAMSNSAINPVIYAFLSKSYHYYYLDMMMKNKTKQETGHNN
ncbi:tachykinin-like peptides receptor 86C isoform X2 [Panonychus citri]|uniref:tachykinin-like peptides receptor 86C isoform X2 n=1 Tax=Panonychus citri TaxID=50023 RepID=UPI002307BA7F|nr:tachykinin-like peptides receptor 86C isoform X2 [Panonychus citri]